MECPLNQYGKDCKKENCALYVKVGFDNNEVTAGCAFVLIAIGSVMGKKFNIKKEEPKDFKDTVLFNEKHGLTK